MKLTGPDLTAGFNRVAHAYDLLVSLNPGYRRHLRLSARRLQLAPGARILDLCCGTGQSTLALHRVFPDATLVALDAAEDMLQVARARPELAGVQFIHGDAMDPRAAGVAGAFDGILMAYGIRNVADADACLAAVRDLLAPRAAVCFHEYSVAGSAVGRTVWRLVTNTIVRPTARIVAGDADLFTYLRDSVLAFDSRAGFERRLYRAGFTAVQTLPMGGWQRGIVHSFLARRPAPAPASTRDRHTAVVVGGGIAGVAAATVLAERGIATTVLERSRRSAGARGRCRCGLRPARRCRWSAAFTPSSGSTTTCATCCAASRPISTSWCRSTTTRFSAPTGAASRSRTFRASRRGISPRSAGAPPSSPCRHWRASAARGAVDAGIRRRTHLPAPRPPLGRRLPGRTALSAARPAHAVRRVRPFVLQPRAWHVGGRTADDVHFYFTGSREGLIFDVARAPFSTAIWQPLHRYLSNLGVRVATGTAARCIRREQGRWLVETGGAERTACAADAVVLALDVPGLQRLLPNTPFRDGAWADALANLATTLPFAVWRLWLDTPTAPGRAPFAGTAGFPLLDNISLFHLFEDESRAWADAHRGSVVELHAYAVPETATEAGLKKALLGGLHRLYPETRTARMLDNAFLLRRDCPAFAPGSHAQRPGVVTPHPGLYLAGDFVRIEAPSALMERAAATGITAANAILRHWHLPPEPVATVRRTGILPRIAA